MNRQERRRLARLKETEARNLEYLEKLQLSRVDAQLDFFAVSIGLAHHNLYGPNKDEFIAPFLAEWNKIICQVVEEQVTFPELQQELLDKTGVYFNIKDQ